MKGLSLIFAVVALTAAQKSHKGSKHGKPYLASSPGAGSSDGGDYYGSSQYDSQPQYQGPKSHSNHGGVTNAKHAYPQLLSDSRTLNHDGTINFNFQADNGLQQGETVDADGTRRGFYSYPDANGKLLTVKYTAGKNGFVAEGDHLPLQPQAAQHSDKDEQDEYSPKQKHGKQEGHDDGSYNPSLYEGSSGQYKKPAPAPYRQHSPSGPRGGSGNSGRYHGGPSYDGPQNSSPYSGGNSNSFSSFGSEESDFPSGFSSPQSNFNNHARAPKPQHAPARHHSGAGRYQGAGGPPSYSPTSHSSPSFGGSGGPSYSSRGAGFTANNPYQPAGAGPYNGNFDLGNSGHFSINFAPGANQEYQPGGQGSSSVPIRYNPSTPAYLGARPSSHRGGQGPRGQY